MVYCIIYHFILYYQTIIYAIGLIGSYQVDHSLNESFSCNFHKVQHSELKLTIERPIRSKSTSNKNQSSTISKKSTERNAIEQLSTSTDDIRELIATTNRTLLIVQSIPPSIDELMVLLSRIEQRVFFSFNAANSSLT